MVMLSHLIGVIANHPAPLICKEQCLAVFAVDQQAEALARWLATECLPCGQRRQAFTRVYHDHGRLFVLVTWIRKARPSLAA
jgi:hypothetical protein